MIRRIPDYCNASLPERFRHWLLQKIAGKNVVLLNARFDMVPQDGVYPVRIINVNGGLVGNCSFPLEDGLMLQISQTAPRHSEQVGAMTNLIDVKACTCPSGDGSLRWPCPVHPPMEPRQ